MICLTPDQQTGQPEQQSLRRRDRILYGFGHFGVSSLGYMVVACVMPFYNPPAAAREAGAMMLVSSATLIGIVLFLSRTVDLIADPLAGFLSDRTRSRWGRRKPYLVISTPLVVLSFILLWYPPVNGASDINAWYALALLCAFFGFFAGYFGPYLGLLPEIARDTNERVKLAMVQGGFNLLGIATGALVVGCLAPRYGYAHTALVLGPLGVVTMWIACLGPSERQCHEPTTGPRMGLRTALVKTFTNVPFLIYWGSYYLYLVSLMVIIAGMEYSASTLMGLPTGASGSISAIPLLGGLLCLPLAKRLTELRGPREAFLIGILWLSCTAPLLGLVGFTHDFSISLWQARGLVALLSPAVAILFTVPYTILSSICDLDFQRTGHHREAMYFGFQGTMLKGALGFAPLIAAVVMRVFQASPNSLLGYRMFGPVAGVMALLGFLLFLFFYPKRQIQQADDTCSDSDVQPASRRV